MKRLLLIPIMLIFWIVNLQAQLSLLPINVDYATFSGSKNMTYTEVYVSFQQGDLSYQVEDSVKVAHFTSIVKIIQNDSLFDERNRNYKNSIEINKNVEATSKFIDAFSFELKPDSYKLIVSVVDDVSSKKGESTVDLVIPEYGKNFNMSMIELATKIGKASSPSNFSTKNNIEIIPSPSITFGVFNPILYYYFEGYNLTLDENGNNRYSYHYYITDQDNNTIRDFSEKIKSSKSSTLAEGNGTNVVVLQSGKYYLNIDLKDLISGQKVTARKKFFIKKPQKEPVTALTAISEEDLKEYASFSKEQLEDEFNKVKYIAVDDEKKIFENLDEEGMKRFFVEFWKRRDFSPETPINEYKHQYYLNIEYTNRAFSTSFREGWLTDRGRIFLIYGKPDNIERFPSTTNMDPYEKWYYYSIEGGIEFYFGDVTGFGQYELLHSTARRELYDPNWMQRITKFGDAIDDDINIR